MDKYTKGVLTVIAVALMSISFQLSNTNLISSAEAEFDYSDRKAIVRALKDIASAIRSCT